MRTYLRRLRRRRRITGAGEGAPPACDGAGAARRAVACVARGEGEECTGARPLARSKRATRRRLPFRKIPILINSFNRLDCLRGLVDWLRGAGYADIIIIDNASSFPPLLSYLERLERKKRATIVRLEANFGHLAIWRHGLLPRLGIEFGVCLHRPGHRAGGVLPGRRSRPFPRNPRRGSRNRDRRIRAASGRHTGARDPQGAGAFVGEPVLAGPSGPRPLPRADRYDLRPLSTVRAVTASVSLP